MSDFPTPNTNFADGNHALRTGMLLGVMLKGGLKAEPGIDDDENYTDEIVITLDDTYPLFPVKVRVKVLPPSPDDNP